MIKISTAIVIILACASCDEDAPVLGKKSIEGGRQKRLLFFDEEGNLVKTYTNPYLRDLAMNAETLPFYGNFLYPFFGFIRQHAASIGGALAAFTIPVSNEVVQQLKKNPSYRNQLLIIPSHDPVIESNPLCQGKREPVPSPKLCNAFLNCWDGWAFEQECPEGLVFSINGYCDYSENVDCQNRRWNGEQKKPDPQCSKDFESFRSKHNCNEFFVCVNRQPVQFKCPADLAYNQILGVCDYPDRVDCSSSPVFAVQPPIVAQPAVDSVSLPPVPTLAFGKPTDGKTVLTENSIHNTQSWISTQIAMSRHDAIRQLQHNPAS